MNNTITVDVRNTMCPGLYGLLGAVRLAKAGDSIELLTTAEADQVEIPAWVEKARYELTAQEDEGSHWKLLVRRTR
jgi:TusA-related sulfurtransferase